MICRPNNDKNQLAVCNQYRNNRTSSLSNIVILSRFILYCIMKNYYLFLSTTQPYNGRGFLVFKQRFNMVIQIKWFRSLFRWFVATRPRFVFTHRFIQLQRFSFGIIQSFFGLLAMILNVLEFFLDYVQLLFHFSDCWLLDFKFLY